jgi:hypothetical protein
MKTFCLFSIHRTGTNYLGSVLKQWPSLHAFGELFHVSQVYGLKPAHLRALSNAAGMEFDDPAAPAFTAWVRANPLAVVEALRRVARRKEKQGIYFKVFLGQWTKPLDEVVAGLAREPGFTPIVLQRRCIDVYVSYRKAEAAGQYKHVDTTDAPVRLDAAAYAHWAAQARAWYAGVVQALARAGTPPRLLTYEHDVDMPPAALTAHWAGLLGVDAPPALDDSLALLRQDRSERLEDKIANADEFFAGLEQRGLREESLRWFLDPAA